MSEGSRLSRWSQRKLAAKQTAKHGGALPELPDIAAENISPGDTSGPAQNERLGSLAKGEPANPPVADANSPDGADQAEAEAMLTEADLPAVEELTAQSDYTVFLQKNVPEALRKAALRKLWVSNPLLANLDGLNDYDDDYSVFTALTMDDTAYKVGRGMLGDEPKAENGPGTEPEAEQEADKTVESSARAEASESQDDLDENSAADGADDDAVEAGNSDAPSAVSSEQNRTADDSESDKA